MIMCPEWWDLSHDNVNGATYIPNSRKWSCINTTVQQLRCRKLYILHIYVLSVLFMLVTLLMEWPWSYGCWILICLWNQCLLPLKLWFWFSPVHEVYWYSIQLSTSVSSTNKNDRHDKWNVVEIVIKLSKSNLHFVKDIEKHWVNSYIKVYLINM